MIVIDTVYFIILYYIILYYIILYYIVLYCIVLYIIPQQPDLGVDDGAVLARDPGAGGRKGEGRDRAHVEVLPRRWGLRVRLPGLPGLQGYVLRYNWS